MGAPPQPPKRVIIHVAHEGRALLVRQDDGSYGPLAANLPGKVTFQTAYEPINKATVALAKRLGLRGNGGIDIVWAERHETPTHTVVPVGLRRRLMEAIIAQEATPEPLAYFVAVEHLGAETDPDGRRLHDDSVLLWMALS